MTRRLAHVNVATMRWDAGDPRMRPFFDAAPAVSAIAQSSPGFVWQLDDADEEARAAELFGEPRLVIAMSVWRDLAALRGFVYRSAHGGFVRRRGEWFVPMTGATKALWWLDGDSMPTVVDAKHRLDWLTRNGPGDVAFGFSGPPQKEQRYEGTG